MKIAVFVHEIFEDLELWYPVIRLREEGYDVVLAGEKAGAFYTGKHGVPAKADVGFDDLNADEYDGLLVPGGFAPDKLRRYDAVKAFTKAMDDAKKPIGHICHAGWVLVSADILKGHKTTSTPAIKDDLINAGAEWVDEQVVVSGNIVSSRNPGDLHAYAKAFISLLKK